jgi:cytoskeleton protein RodZ
MGNTQPQTKAPQIEARPGSEIDSKGAKPAAVVSGAVASKRMSEADKEAGLSGLEDRSRTKALILSAVCVFLVILIFSTKKVIDRYQRESIPGEVEVTAPLPEPVPLAGEVPSATTPTAATDTSVTTVSPPSLVPDEKPAAETAAVFVPPAATPQAAPTTPIAAPTAPALVTAPKPVTTPPVVAQPAQTPAPAAPAAPAAVVPKPAPTPPATPVLAEKPKEEVKPVEKKPVEKPAPKGRSLELIVEALDSVNMEYADASGEMQKLTLEAGKVHTIRSRNGLKLNVNNGGAVNLILNGRDLGAPGDIGKPVTLSY